MASHPEAKIGVDFVKSRNAVTEQHWYASGLLQARICENIT